MQFDRQVQISVATERADRAEEEPDVNRPDNNQQGNAQTLPSAMNTGDAETIDQTVGRKPMSDRQARENVMRRPMIWLRVVLYLVVTALVGVWAALWPRSFYDDFPWPGHPWVAPLGAYNEHLVRDFGAMNLAMAVVLGVAAVTLDRRLAATALAAYLVFALPHLAFHLQHLEPFGTVDAVAQVVTLAAAALVPLPLLALLYRAHARPPKARSLSA